jgi:hypothetical protein
LNCMQPPKPKLGLFRRKGKTPNAPLKPRFGRRGPYGGVLLALTAVVVLKELSLTWVCISRHGDWILGRTPRHLHDDPPRAQLGLHLS